jgi:hypothetical protein
MPRGEARFSRDDRLPAPPGRVDPRCIGLTADRSLTLESGGALEAIAGDRMLIADGWIEYPYDRTLFAAWQAGADYHAPTIEARGADRRWVTVCREFGYPAGMPRRMSLPLGPLPRGTTALRLHTTQEISWDRLAAGDAAFGPAAATTVLPLVSASVEKTGFERPDRRDQRRPSYDDNRRAPLSDARCSRGAHTALGPVTDLVAANDGALAIIGPGEAIDLVYRAPLPPLRPRWTRRYVLDARGWCKDMDRYTRDGDTVEPPPGRRAGAAAELERRDTTRGESGR